MTRLCLGWETQQDEEQIQCPICGKWFDRQDMEFSRDCHGITFRLLCYDCLEEVYSTKGYDGEYYTEADENIWEDY